MPSKDTASALLTTVRSTRRRKMTVSFLPDNTETMLITSTAKVVILTPPPVEPLPAPMNIKRIIPNFVRSCSAFMSTEAKPAVRVVIDWNSAAVIFWESGSGPSVAGLLYSSENTWIKP